MEAARPTSDPAGGRQEGPQEDLQEAPEKGRLPLVSKVAYAAPGLASAGLALPIYALMPKFYSDAFGAPLGLIALAIAVARAFDAITDPAMGWISDRFPTRWGRRRPWIALGVPLTSLSILALFGPPAGLSPTVAALWFGLSFAAYFLFHTVYFVPYGALLAGFGFHSLRLGAALRLLRNPPDSGVLKTHLNEP